MRPQTTVICELIGNLIEQGGSALVDKMKAEPKGDLKRKIMSYSRRPFEVIWTHANDDLVALIAVSDLMYERRIQPLSRLDEEGMQRRFGVNALSAQDMKQAVAAMQREKEGLQQLRDQCDAMLLMSKTLVARTWFSDFLSSQPHFDELARQELNKRCETNKKAIGMILTVISTVLPMNERILHAHRTRRSFPQ